MFHVGLALTAVVCLGSAVLWLTLSVLDGRDNSAPQVRVGAPGPERRQALKRPGEVLIGLREEGRSTNGTHPLIWLEDSTPKCPEGYGNDPSLNDPNPFVRYFRKVYITVAESRLEKVRHFIEYLDIPNAVLVPATTPKDVPSKTTLIENKKVCCKQASMGMVGNWISKMRTFKAIVADGLHFCHKDKLSLIFEDDLDLTRSREYYYERIEAFFESLAKRHVKYDYVLLGWCLQRWKQENQLAEGLMKAFDPVCGHAWAISPKAASGLLENDSTYVNVWGDRKWIRKPLRGGTYVGYHPTCPIFFQGRKETASMLNEKNPLSRDYGQWEDPIWINRFFHECYHYPFERGCWTWHNDTTIMTKTVFTPSADHRGRGRECFLWSDLNSHRISAFVSSPKKNGCIYKGTTELTKKTGYTTWVRRKCEPGETGEAAVEAGGRFLEGSAKHSKKSNKAEWKTPAEI